MGKLENFGALVLLALAICGSDLWLERALAYPADVPANPVKYKRYLRHYPAPNHPELEIYEVRELYYVRRPAPPPPKKIQKLSDLDMELRIRCDFEPTLPLCKKSDVRSESDWTGATQRTTTAQPTPAWRTTDSTTSTSTSTSSSSSSSTSTTTDLPMLPLLPDLEEVTEETPETTESTSLTPAKEQGSEPDDAYNDDYDDEEDKEDTELDDTVIAAEPEFYLNPSGSIGGIDTS